MNIFLSCVKAKESTYCSAEQMYISPLFKKSLQYAKTFKNANIYILSAKYGLLKLSDMIYPYDETLNTMNNEARDKWSKMVLRQCTSENIDFNEEAIFLCGKKYREKLQKHFTNSKAPLSHLGIGKQLQFYTNALNKK